MKKCHLKVCKVSGQTHTPEIRPPISMVTTCQDLMAREEVFDLLVLGVFLGEENATEAAVVMLCEFSVFGHTLRHWTWGIGDFWWF